MVGKILLFAAISISTFFRKSSLWFLMSHLYEFSYWKLTLLLAVLAGKGSGMA